MFEQKMMVNIGVHLRNVAKIIVYIRLEKIVSKTSQYNRVAERMNHTICERIWCILSYVKLFIFFWGEAIRTIVDLINLSFSISLQNDMPERVWIGKDTLYDHLRVFGYRVFIYISKNDRSKFDRKSKQHIFLGYAYKEFSYGLKNLVD